MSAALMFVSAFLLVALLALQSLNTNGRHFVGAFITSFCIGAMHLFVLRSIPFTDDIITQAAYLAGGPFGAVVAMWAHPRLRRLFANRERAANTNCGADRP